VGVRGLSRLVKLQTDEKAGFTLVDIPAANAKVATELNPEVLNQMVVMPVRTILEALSGNLVL
jgi:predicted ATP-dependent protease